MENKTVPTAIEMAQKGKELFNQGMAAKAHRCYISAILKDPQNSQYRRMFAKCLPSVGYTQYNKFAQTAIDLCLDDPFIAHRQLSNGWLQLVKKNPAMAPLITLLSIKSKEEFFQTFDAENFQLYLNNIFFCKGLRKCLLMDFQFEILLVRIRQYFLLKASSEQRLSVLPFLQALATKCFSNEYVFEVAPEEIEQINILKNTPDLAIADVFLLASYIPLYEWSGAEKFITRYSDTLEEGAKEIIRLQIIEPSKEKDIEQNVESFSPVNDDISNQVRGQYEEHPYPRWQSITPALLGPLKKKQSEDRDVLVAGCGTGQESALIASQMPNAEIDAIDLSRVSLAYAIRQSSKNRLSNIRYLQGDILECSKLNKKYDIIFSSGVLHHMKDPLLGLKSLKNILKNDGVMAIALYSEIARSNIVKVQNWIIEKGYLGTSENIRQFRQDVFSLPDDNPIKKIIYVSDFYNLSECRDLLFHVQEHRFTCLDLKKMIEEQGLVLLDFCGRFPIVKKAYLAQYPDDPQALNLENWHEFEKSHPQSFLRMYDMVLGRKEAFSDQKNSIPDWLKGLGIFSE